MKLFNILLCLSLCLLAASQSGSQTCYGYPDTKKAPPAKTPTPPGYSSSKWYCTFTFYRDSDPYFIDDLYYGQTKAFRSYFGKRGDNMINEFSWEGTRCYCWVVFWANQKYGGNDVGIWVSSNSGSYDLKNLITYGYSSQYWYEWDQYCSSYSVYCY